MTRGAELRFARSPIGLADLIALVHRLKPQSPEPLFQLAHHLGFRAEPEVTSEPATERPPRAAGPSTGPRPLVDPRG